MKVSIERLEELGLYQRPPDPPGRRERLKAFCIRIHDRTKEALSRITFQNMARWQKEGFAAMACVSAIGLTITAVGLNINPGDSPPGTVPGTMQATYVPGNEMAAGNTEDIKVTRMALMESENTVDIMTLTAPVTDAAGQVPGDAFDEQTSEELPSDDMEAADELFTDSENTDDEWSEQEESTDEDNSGDEEIPDEEDADEEEISDEEEQADNTDIDEEDADEEEPADDTEDTESEDTEPEEEESEDAEPEEEEEPEVLLAMADVDSVLNVRAEADADSERVGVLYKDTGGKVLEQKDGWSKIESGELVGWAMDDYLVFGDEVKQRADESGNMVATISTDSLRVREEPNSLATILGYVSNDDVLTVAAMGDNGWVEITYNDTTGYINGDYLTVEPMLASGDTVEAIQEKEEAKKQAEREEAEKRASEARFEMTLVESYEGTISDMELLATIIYCEAGNQSHEGKVAVGNVVINRVNSGSFPNTFEAVIRAPRQFSPVASGKFDRMLGSGRVPENCYVAAQDAMDGISYVGDCLYFKNPKIAGAHAGITIGDHVFW